MILRILSLLISCSLAATFLVAADEPEASPLAVLASGVGRIEALPGHPVLRGPAGEAVFTGGFRHHLTLAHSGTPSSTIVIRSLLLEVLQFEPGQRQHLTYRINADELPIAGTAKPHEFRISLFGKTVGRAVWIENDGETVLRSQSEDFLATDPRRVFRLTPGRDEVEDLLSTVLAQEPGFYRVRYRIRYSFGNLEREAVTESIAVYFETAVKPNAHRQR